MDTLDKVKLGHVVFSQHWKDFEAFLEMRAAELMRQAIVEDDEKTRIVQKGKYLFVREILALRGELESLNHKP